jgi:hypothetical protein
MIVVTEAGGMPGYWVLLLIIIDHYYVVIMG